MTQSERGRRHPTVIQWIKAHIWKWRYSREQYRPRKGDQLIVGGWTYGPGRRHCGVLFTIWSEDHGGRWLPPITCGYSISHPHTYHHLGS